MSDVIHISYREDLSTPKYNPALHVILGHYCGPNQHFVPMVDLRDKDDPKCSILRLNKDKLIHRIVIDGFKDKTFYVENDKGQRSYWTCRDNEALAQIMEIISNRYHGELITKIKSKKNGESYTVKFCNQMYDDNDLYGNEIFMSFFDYIEPGFFINWIKNSWDRRNNRQPSKNSWFTSLWEKKKKFNWPKNEFIKV